MRRIIVIFLLLISYNLYAIGTNITFGIQENNLYFKEHSNLYISIDVYQNIGDFRVYGNYKNEFHYGNLEFIPTQDYFTVGASYDIGFVTIRAEHMCQHPVVTYYDWGGGFGAYTKFEITIGD